MGDGSFPADYWREFRQSVKSAKPDAPILGELWKKGEMLPKIHGDQADSGQTYRFRNAVLGYLGTVDDKGFSDDGQSLLPPSFFAEKLRSIREDYPDAAYYTAMNLLTSHDTQRILWLLTPGARTREEREFNAASLALGKLRLRLAALLQMTVPGAPAIYYGDEIALSGDDDPDDRRTFPWSDLNTRIYLPIVMRGSASLGDDPETSAPVAASGAPLYYGALGDHSLLDHYRALTALRAATPVLREGALQFLLTDDQNGTMAYMMRTITDTAIIALNRYTATQTLTIPYAPTQLPNGLNLVDALGVISPVVTVNGVLTVTLPPMAGVVLRPTGNPDLTPPAAPQNLAATSGNGQVMLTWNASAGAAAYAVYRSPLTGGGYVLLASGLTTLAYTDTTITNGRQYFYVVTARDAVNNEGAASNEAVGRPAFPIVLAIIDRPAILTHTLGITPTSWIYGRAMAPGVTDMGGNPNSIYAQIGYGPSGSTPVTWTTWTAMTYNGTFSQTFEYQGRFRPEGTGAFEYVARFSTNGGYSWIYAGLTGIGTMGGSLVVQANSDATPPAAPTLSLINNAASFLTVQWTPVGDAAEYWLYRSTNGTMPATPYAQLTSATTVFTDSLVTTGQPYTYMVKAADHALNLSATSNVVSAAPTPRNVSVTFNVNVPATTPITRNVYIVGNQPQICGWCDPHTVQMMNMGGNVWSITLVFSETTGIEYKYTLGSWTYVEKTNTCAEVSNRQVTVSGIAPTQMVSNTVVNWRNIAPCGN
jgi:fibronectin type 3 domain-containing protein